MTQLDDIRRIKDQYFATDTYSPLTPEQRQHFQGLSYFADNPALRLEVQVEEFVEKDTVVMQTTTGDEREYTRYGRIKFSVNGQPAELTLYSGEHGFFLPFVDALAGTDTYPAGRYLEPEPLHGNTFLVDFNTAYNPYCAYNDQWSCPITPVENRLKVPINAGEKLFHA
jgi:uncharacterized protein (DUF1684 family)